MQIKGTKINVDWRQVRQFQPEGMKQGSKNGLLKSLRDGIIGDLFILFTTDETPEMRIFDGHSRQDVMLESPENWEQKYECSLVYFKDDKAAAAALIRYQAGKLAINGDVYQEFVQEYEIEVGYNEIYEVAVVEEENKVNIDIIDDDFDAAPPKQSITVLGDLYEIGEHRLLCGDSTDSDQVAKLMDGQKADMVFTDPPYRISVVKNDKVGADFGVAKKGKYSEVIADDTTDTAQEFYNTCQSLGFDKYIIWGGNYFTDFLPFSDGWLIWNKRAGPDIRNTFADGEMAWCSFHTPIRIYDQLWNGMIREGEKEKRVHPTQKPIRMLSEIIEDHIKGNLIFDGFLGSGSTMVASHQLKRKCYGMELDPKYCDVIVARMIKLVRSLSSGGDIIIKRNGKILKKEDLQSYLDNTCSN